MPIRLWPAFLRVLFVLHASAHTAQVSACRFAAAVTLLAMRHFVRLPSDANAIVPSRPTKSARLSVPTPEIVCPGLITAIAITIAITIAIVTAIVTAIAIAALVVFLAAIPGRAKWLGRRHWREPRVSAKHQSTARRRLVLALRDGIAKARRRARGILPKTGYLSQPATEAVIPVVPAAVHIAAAPRSTDPAAARDPLGPAFRSLDAGFERWMAVGTTTVVRMRAVRATLVPFLDETAQRRPSTTRPLHNVEHIHIHRPAAVLDRWWRSILDMLPGAGRPGAVGIVATEDVSGLLDAIAMIMTRPELHSIPGTAAVLDEPAGGHNVGAMFCRNVLTQMALVVESMQFYVLAQDFMPGGLTLAQTARAPAFVMLPPSCGSMPPQPGQHPWVGSRPTAPLLPRSLSARMADNPLIILLKDMLAESTQCLATGAKKTFAEAFLATAKAAGRRIPPSNFTMNLVLCDFLEEALAVLTVFQNRSWKGIMDSGHASSGVCIISLLYSLWDIATADPVWKEAVFFNHWSPLVWAYYMRLLCWRVCRDLGTANELDRRIFLLVSARLGTAWSHHLSSGRQRATMSAGGGRLPPPAGAGSRLVITYARTEPHPPALPLTTSHVYAEPRLRPAPMRRGIPAPWSDVVEQFNKFPQMAEFVEVPVLAYHPFHPPTVSGRFGPTMAEDAELFF
ncbi:hypothetical protein B0H63DRAFT_515812 [Podospora didyma]|uniref:Uncharacterized protein n=1 Tax=Podospora didyma TaxID=330526 RepID=A0AAE0JYY7_9PEZI|nr:hypothetical protein B0H63DRAFT_515812 [Podospora didyma]